MKDKLKKFFNKDNIFKIEMVVCMAIGSAILALELPTGLAIVWLTMGIGGLVLDEIAEEKAEERQVKNQIDKGYEPKLSFHEELNLETEELFESKSLSANDSNVVSEKDSLEKKAEELLQTFIANNDKINATEAVELMDAVTKVLIDGISDDLIDYYNAKLNEYERLFYDGKEQTTDLNRARFIGGIDE